MMITKWTIPSREDSMSALEYVTLLVVWCVLHVVSILAMFWVYQVDLSCRGYQQLTGTIFLVPVFCIFV